MADDVTYSGAIELVDDVTYSGAIELVQCIDQIECPVCRKVFG